MSTPSADPQLPASEFVAVWPSVISTAVVFPAGGIVFLLVAALTGMHDWGLAVATGAGGTIGYGFALASGTSPALRAAKQGVQSVSAGDVELRSLAASVAPGPIVLLAMGVYFALGPEDLATPGAIVLGIGSVTWLEVAATRRWEKEHGARLAAAVRPRRERFRHPFRRPRLVGVRHFDESH